MLQSVRTCRSGEKPRLPAAFITGGLMIRSCFAMLFSAGADLPLITGPGADHQMILQITPYHRMLLSSNTGPSSQASLQPLRVCTAHAPHRANPEHGMGVVISTCVGQGDRTSLPTPNTPLNSPNWFSGTSTAKKSGQSRAVFNVASGDTSTTSGSLGIFRSVNSVTLVCLSSREVIRGLSLDIVSPVATIPSLWVFLGRLNPCPNGPSRSSLVPGPHGTGNNGLTQIPREVSSLINTGVPSIALLSVESDASRYCPGAGTASPGQRMHISHCPPTSRRISLTLPV
jgi:hypothetical protein